MITYDSVAILGLKGGYFWEITGDGGLDILLPHSLSEKNIKDIVKAMKADHYFMSRYKQTDNEGKNAV